MLTDPRESVVPVECEPSSVQPPALAIPVPVDEHARLAKLRAYDILDTPPERAFERITQIAASVLETPIALVSLIDSSRQWFKSRVGLDVAETPRDLAFCAHAIMEPGVMVVEDARLDARFASNPLVVGDPNIRFYAGAPLRTPDGFNLGTLCTIDRVPRQATPAQTRLLEDLAGLVIDELELRLAATHAVKEVAERSRVEATLREQQRLLELLHTVAATANEATEPSVVVQHALARVCAFAGWSVGYTNLSLSRGANNRVRRAFWALNPSGRQHDAGRTPDGSALPVTDLARRVVASHAPEIISAPAHDLSGPQAAFGSGVRSGIGIPVLAGTRLSGVLEFYTDEPVLAIDGFVLQALMDVAGHVGRAIERDTLSRMKDDFIATVSHELRTPLTSINGSIGLIKHGVAGPLDERAGAMLDVAYRNSDRLIRLVNDLLDIQGMDTGAVRLNLEPVAVSRLIDLGLDANRDFCEQRGLTLRVRGAVPPLVVTADPGRLTQVLTNLVSNAAKFSPEGGEIVVDVTGRGAGVRIAVTDSGPGIPEEFRSRIFGRFAQADPSDARQKSGTGLGLSICKGIVEQHGGTIGFTSEPQQGTTFYFHLPLADVPAFEVAQHV